MDRKTTKFISLEAWLASIIEGDTNSDLRLKRIVKKLMINGPTTRYALAKEFYGSGETYFNIIKRDLDKLLERKDLLIVSEKGRAKTYSLSEQALAACRKLGLSTPVESKAQEILDELLSFHTRVLSKEHIAEGRALLTKEVLEVARNIAMICDNKAEFLGDPLERMNALMIYTADYTSADFFPDYKLTAASLLSALTQYMYEIMHQEELLKQTKTWLKIFTPLVGTLTEMPFNGSALFAIPMVRYYKVEKEFKELITWIQPLLHQNSLARYVWTRGLNEGSDRFWHIKHQIKIMQLREEKEVKK